MSAVDSTPVGLPDTPREDPLAYIDARSYVDGLARRQQARFRGISYATLGTAGVAHPVGPHQWDDGSITLEPLCNIGYHGASQDRLIPVSRPDPAHMCRRPGCANYVPPQHLPQHRRGEQLDLLALMES